VEPRAGGDGVGTASFRRQAPLCACCAP